MCCNRAQACLRQNCLQTHTCLSSKGGTDTNTTLSLADDVHGKTKRLPASRRQSTQRSHVDGGVGDKHKVDAGGN
jgi:hypothetical protein